MTSFLPMSALSASLWGLPAVSAATSSSSSRMMSAVRHLDQEQHTWRRSQ